MNKQTKVIRINLRTWNKLRRDIPGRKYETISEYLDRVLGRVE